MGNKYTPIAMLCNQEQFDAIKPKLEGLFLNNPSSFNEYPYLVNYNGGDYSINTVNKKGFKYLWDGIIKIYETWNEQIFLEACGIKTEKQMKITKENIIRLDKKETTVRELFPSLFTPVLEKGKWYIFTTGTIGFCQGENKTSYGIHSCGKEWFNDHSWFRTDNLKDIEREATHEEVFEALKNEAVKKGFVGNIYVDLTPIGFYNNELLIGNEITWKDGFLNYGTKGTAIFRDGKWANSIPTISVKEAEKLLNKKIV